MTATTRTKISKKLSGAGQSNIGNFHDGKERGLGESLYCLLQIFSEIDLGEDDEEVKMFDKKRVIKSL